MGSPCPNIAAPPDEPGAGFVGDADGDALVDLTAGPDDDAAPWDNAAAVGCDLGLAGLASLVDGLDPSAGPISGIEVHQRDGGPVVSTSGDPLACFLRDMASAPPAPLLLKPPSHSNADAAAPSVAPAPPPPNLSYNKTPAHSKTAATPKMAAPQEPVRHSGRLSGKATYGMPALEKAHLVLLKKGGFCSGGEPPKEGDILRYKEMYKKPLPPDFI